MSDHDCDRVFESGVAFGASRPKVVEAPQNVMVPARGKREPGHSLVGDFPRSMGAVKVVLTEKLPGVCFGCLDSGALGSAGETILPQTLQDIDGGVE